MHIFKDLTMYKQMLKVVLTPLELMTVLIIYGINNKVRVYMPLPPERTMKHRGGSKGTDGQPFSPPAL